LPGFSLFSPVIISPFSSGFGAWFEFSYWSSLLLSSFLSTCLGVTVLFTISPRRCLVPFTDSPPTLRSPPPLSLFSPFSSPCKVRFGPHNHVRLTFRLIRSFSKCSSGGSQPLLLPDHARNFPPTPHLRTRSLFSYSFFPPPAQFRVACTVLHLEFPRRSSTLLSVRHRCCCDRETDNFHSSLLRIHHCLPPFPPFRCSPQIFPVPLCSIHACRLTPEAGRPLRPQKPSVLDNSSPP